VDWISLTQGGVFGGVLLTQWCIFGIRLRWKISWLVEDYQLLKEDSDSWSQFLQCSTIYPATLHPKLFGEPYPRISTTINPSVSFTVHSCLSSIHKVSQILYRTKHFNKSKIDGKESIHIVITGSHIVESSHQTIFTHAASCNIRQHKSTCPSANLVYF
jgi:hypothetical protein